MSNSNTQKNAVIAWDPRAFTPVGLDPDYRDAMSDEDLHEAQERLNECNGQILWWRGDILAERKKRATKSGKEEANLEFDLGLPLEGEVASAFPFEDRHPSLLFEHHREVYALAPEQAKYWLNQADTNGWTVKEMRQNIRESGSDDRFGSPEKPSIAKKYEKLYGEAGRLSRIDPETLPEDELATVIEIIKPITDWLARAGEIGARTPM